MQFVRHHMIGACKDRHPTNRRRDCPYRGDRLREEYRKLKEQMALLERLIMEAVRSHK